VKFKVCNCDFKDHQCTHHALCDRLRATGSVRCLPVQEIKNCGTKLVRPLDTDRHVGPFDEFQHGKARQLPSNAFHARLSERHHHLLLEGSELLGEPGIPVIKGKESVGVGRKGRGLHLRVVAPPALSR